jgi:hypothetical protein
MTTKRRILLCRWGFVLFCLLPTLVVGLWVVARADHRGVPPIAAEQLAHDLSNRLGLVVAIERASGTQRALRIEGLRLRDPETREVVAEAAAVEAVYADDAWQIEAFQPVVNLTHLAPLLPRLHDRLLCGPAAKSEPLHLAGRDVLLTSNAVQHSLARLAASLSSSEEGPLLAVELQPTGHAAEPIRLSVVRNRQAAAPRTNWQLATSGQPLPLAWLADWMPQLARLGSECQFIGTVTCSEATEADWSGELSGTLTHVDFDTLVTEHFPHQLSGLGTVQIERATIQDGRLAEFRGGIDIVSGSVSRSLLAAGQEHLGLTQSSQTESTGDSSIPFQRLALDIALDGRLLRITGRTGRQDEQAVMLGHNGVLVSSTSDHAVPAVSLLRALLPDNQFQVPATRQTDALVGLLPIPDLAPLRTATRHSHIPMRLRSSGPADEAPALRQPGLR